jgi:sarcosine/dimethylglycine N-methyltransferase
VTEVLDGVREHYGATSLTERLDAALGALGPQDLRLTPEQLGALDQFHTRGLAATAELARLAGITVAMSVLDVGAGIGGPARFLAATFGCRVTGVDLSEPFVQAARYLTERTGQGAQVSPDGQRSGTSFRGRRFRRRVSAACGEEYSRPGAALPRDPTRAHVKRQVCDLRRRVEKWRAVPWARTPATSFLLTATATRDEIEPAGFRTIVWQDDTETAKAWIARLRASGPPPSPNLSVIMGPDFAQLATNLGRNLIEGRLGVLTAVFEAAAAKTQVHMENH